MLPTTSPRTKIRHHNNANSSSRMKMKMHPIFVLLLSCLNLFLLTAIKESNAFSSSSFASQPSHHHSALHYTASTNLTIRLRGGQKNSDQFNLTHESLAKLQHLVQLDLGLNDLDELPPDLFCPLTNLKVLNLTHNRLTNYNSFGLISSTGALCLEELEQLDLSHNKLKQLTQTGVASLKNLRVLRLNHNQIDTVAEISLQSLSKLQIIDLSSNRLSTISPRTFAKSEELREIYLQNNSLSRLPPELFAGLSKLLVLNLSHNQISSESVQRETFLDLIRVIILDLSYNQIKHINDSVFVSLYSVQVLDLSHNEITSISDKAFDALYNLDTLVLSHNQLKAVQDTMLNALFVLTKLDLSYNDISTLSDSSFQNCTNLRDINLYGNLLREFPPAVSKTRRLEHLYLGNNEITSISSRLIANLTQLRTLDLRSNLISNLTKSSFSGLKLLRKLDLSENRIQNVEQNLFDENLSLEWMDLHSNELREINSMFPKLDKLVYLNVSRNLIGWFDYALIPFSLKILDLRHNRIEHLGNYFELDPEIQLKSIDLSHNQISAINEPLIPSSIMFFNLSHNQLTKLPHYIFARKTNLTVIDLSYNQFTTISESELRINANPLKSVPEYRLAGNPYICDCTMEWLHKLSQEVALQTAALAPSMSGQNSSNNNLASLTSTSFSGSFAARPSPSNSGLFYPLHQPYISDLSSLKCSLQYKRDAVEEMVALSEADSSKFLCPYKTHCFALCHCCEFDACDCEMVCPEGCRCFYDSLWRNNIVDCSLANHTNVPARIPMDVTELYLDGNTITNLGSHLFLGKKNLQRLYLNHSNVHTISNRTFNGLILLEVLHLDHNRLTKLDGHELLGLRNLKELHLNDNQLQTINASTFMHLKYLQILHLERNALLDFQIWSLDYNPILNSVYIGDNPWLCHCDFLQEMSRWYYTNGGHQLVKDSQQLRCYYQGDISSPGPRITELNETNCGLSTASLTNYTRHYNGHHHHGHRPSLSSNSPSVPSSSSVDYRKQYGSGKMDDMGRVHHHPQQMAHDTGFASSSNGFGYPNHQGQATSDTTSRFLSSMNSSSSSSSSIQTHHTSSENRHNARKYMPWLIIAPCIIVIFIIGSLTAGCIYRQQISMWMYTKYGVRLFQRGSNGLYEDGGEKLFDAFVSYCKKDEAFIAQILAPELECGHPPYRLCLRYRDLTLTGYVAEAITEAIEFSHRTILLLSEHFLKSEWCRFELKQAYNESIRNKFHKLVVVVLDKRTLSELDADAKICLSGATLVQWGDRKFWEKLRYSMPPGRHQQGSATLKPMNCSDVRASLEFKRALNSMGPNSAASSSTINHHHHPSSVTVTSTTTTASNLTGPGPAGPPMGPMMGLPLPLPPTPLTPSPPSQMNVNVTLNGMHAV